MSSINYRSVRPLIDSAAPHLFIETYGCQMNVNDSEVVLSILQKAGFTLCQKPEDAALVLINTCAIRDNAWNTTVSRKNAILTSWWVFWVVWRNGSKTNSWRIR